MTTADFSSLWVLLSEETRRWLVDHNGEPLDPAVLAELTRAAPDGADSRWLDAAGENGPALSDEAVDWVEARANGE